MCSDEQLLTSFRGGDKAAGDKLLTRYKNTVLSVAHRFFLVGGDTEDLVQEGMCGLYSAMSTFKGESGFSAYAYACIKNRILDAVKKEGSNKNFALNGSVSMDSEDDVADGGISPEEALIINEVEGEFDALIKSELSPLEYKTIKLYIYGATITEISAALGKTYKQTDNSLSRAKTKLKKLYQCKRGNA